MFVINSQITNENNKKTLTTENHQSDELIQKLDHLAEDICSKLDTLSEYQQKSKPSDFYIRQLVYEEVRQHNINEIRQKQIKDGLKQHYPKINQSADLINNYFTKKLNDQNSKLLKFQEKQIQTVEPSYTGQMLSQRNKKKTLPYSNKTVQKFSSASQCVTKQDIETQTDFEYELSNVKIQSQIESKTSDIYIPIWDRVKYIKESQQQSINEKIQLKKQKEDEYIKSLDFKPQLTTPNKKKIINEQEAQSFFESQTKWQAKIKQRSIHQSFCDDAPEQFSFRPKILSKFILSEKKMNDQSKSIYDRNLDRQEKTQAKIQQQKYDEYTFKPHVNRNVECINLLQKISNSKSPLALKINTQRSGQKTKTPQPNC